MGGHRGRIWAFGPHISSQNPGNPDNWRQMKKHTVLREFCNTRQCLRATYKSNSKSRLEHERMSESWHTRVNNLYLPDASPTIWWISIPHRYPSGISATQINISDEYSTLMPVSKKNTQVGCDFPDWRRPIGIATL